MLAPLKNIHALTNIHRERVLPILGHVVARRLQKVEPTDVIVEAQLEPEYILLDIAGGLKVSPERADELLQRQEGEELSEGDVIAGPVGLFQRVIRAPFPGVVRIAGEGKILFEKTGDSFELQAGMEGTVTSIIPERGAALETRGVLIQGVWGNRQITYGVLNVRSEVMNQELKSDQIDISHRGSIVAGGFCREEEALRNAAAVPVKGLILGSLSAHLIPVAREMNYPLIIVDGFGSRPLNKTAARLLMQNNERNAALNAQAYDPFQGDYPEVTISLPVSEEVDPPLEADNFFPNQQVYVTSGPGAGRDATVTRILPQSHQFPSGIKAAAAEIKFENGKERVVPLRNLRIRPQAGTFK